MTRTLPEYWHLFKQWIANTPDRSLLDAYQAAQAIKRIESEHFEHQKISRESAKYTESVMSYWLGYLEQNLAIIKVRLAEFNLSRSFVNKSNSALLEKLKFIDEVIYKYIPPNEPISSNQLIVISQPQEVESYAVSPLANPPKSPDITQKTDLLPRSLGRTINQIGRDLNPKAEEEFLKSFRFSKKRTRSAIKFLFLIIIVPFLTQVLSKELLISHIVERVRSGNTVQVFLNSQMEKEALEELKSFEKKLEFQNLLHQAPEISPTVIEEKVKVKAKDIAEEFAKKSNGAISNVFADFISLIGFAIIIITNKKEIVIVKSFMDEIIYGLSDSAKAFIIILFTDIFVGFHSPHGWEVLLEGFAEHLGVSASRSWIFLFIATFPVILDTIFKYWIFRYLSRLSPSALATLKEMDE